MPGNCFDASSATVDTSPFRSLPTTIGKATTSGRRSPGPSFARLRLTGRRKCDNWDGARRHALVFGVLRIPLRLIDVHRIALYTAQFNGMYVEVLVSDFDAGVGVGDEVPVPRGAAVNTSGRGEQQVATVVGQIHQWVHPFLATSCSGRV